MATVGNGFNIHIIKKICTFYYTKHSEAVTPYYC